MFDWLFKKKEEPAKVQKRRFDAAMHNRLVQSWQSVCNSINEDLKGDIDTIRGRARDLAQNDPMVKKYLALTAANVVGSTGIKHQARVMLDNGKPDKPANIAIEKAWKRFKRLINLDELERVIIQCVARDGEALIFKRFTDNEFGYSLQLLDVSRLATILDRESDNNHNAIIMGVEIDDLGTPVAYHLYADNYGQDVNNRKTIRYKADRIFHLFRADYPEQVRGMSWMHASMVRIRHLKKYQEFALIASAVGASKMGFFTQPEGDGTVLADGEDEETGELYQEAAAGQFGILPEGVGFTPFDPDYPHAMYEQFIKAAKRDISSGLNVSYHSLANDLEGVNFSSIRSGTLDDREQWKVIQDWFITSFMEPMYAEWLSTALLRGAIKSNSGVPLPASKREKFMAHEFSGRRWQWVDPLKDEQANKVALEQNLASPFKIAAQKGEDVEEVISDIARFNDMLREAGITQINQGVTEDDDEENNTAGN